MATPQLHLPAGVSCPLDKRALAACIMKRGLWCLPEVANPTAFDNLGPRRPDAGLRRVDGAAGACCCACLAARAIAAARGGAAVLTPAGDTARSGAAAALAPARDICTGIGTQGGTTEAAYSRAAGGTAAGACDADGRASAAAKPGATGAPGATAAGTARSRGARKDAWGSSGPVLPVQRPAAP